MKLNKDLQLEYTRMMVRDGFNEFLHSITLSKYQNFIVAAGDFDTGNPTYGSFGIIVRID